MRAPCFDTSTRTDCPRRHAGCAATCPDWAKYEKKRKERYEKRADESKQFTDYAEVRKKRMNLYLKRRLRIRRSTNISGGTNNE